jgi:dipeptidase E
MKRLLLLSNSTNHGAGYLDHAFPAIRELLGPARSLAFVPFALKEREGYAAKVAGRFGPEGIVVREVPAESNAGTRVLEEADAVFVGGGNTFRLADTLHRTGLMDVLRRLAEAGRPYLGASAGTNITAPTLKTTNDMPIVEPPSFATLGLVPFQINPHYLDPDPGSRHMGETRETRLREYLEENDVPVLGLREGSWLVVNGAAVRLEGPHAARVFRRGRDPEERPPGALDLAG